MQGKSKELEIFPHKKIKPYALSFLRPNFMLK